ncbi:hypothetical protein MACH10_05320 [Thalassospira tepidiphila]|nr:hypothetical protein MACH10_05320 [Thalassospira tepidiphila]
MVVVSLALFSSHWVTYFAAIFIVATAVTELEFLQNLAAIIRKDENYFNYKKEHLSYEEKMRRANDDTIDSDLVNYEIDDDKEKTTIDLSNFNYSNRIHTMRLNFDIEDKVLNYLEKEFGKIERGIRFSKGVRRVEFDGVVVGAQGQHRLVIEVKWRRDDEYPFTFILHSLRRFAERFDEFTEITGEFPDRYFVLVLNDSSGISQECKDKLYKLAGERGIKVKFLTLTEVGFNVVT